MAGVLPAPLLLVLAGVAAGLSGSMAGLASLFSYPALLAVGLPPTVANQANTIALAGARSSSIVSSRPELRGQRARMLRLLPLTILGGVIGGALVLVTPSETFALIVPFLVGGASLVLLRPPRPVPPSPDGAAPDDAAPTTPPRDGPTGSSTGLPGSHRPPSSARSRSASTPGTSAPRPGC